MMQLSYIFDEVSAMDLLRYLERTHINEVRGSGNCDCDICDAWGVISHVAGAIHKQRTDRAAARAEVLDNEPIVISPVMVTIAEDDAQSPQRRVSVQS